MKNILWLIIVLLFSCKNPADNRQALLLKNGIQNIQVGDVQLYSKLSPELINDQNEEESKIIYFNVRIERESDQVFEKEKLLYLDFDMQQDFALNMGSRMLLPSFCQKIPNGRNNSYEYILAFDTGQKEMPLDQMKLTYKDKTFGIGIIEFVYNPSDIKKPESKS